MRLPCRPAALFLALSLAAACGSGKAPGSCSKDSECPAGEGCVSGTCQALPCGGCQPEEACNTGTQKCEPAQGATCSDHACPTGYPCNGTVCAAPCGTSDSDCPQGLHCSNHSCVQCLSDTQCDSVNGKPKCDLTSGNCVQCNADFDCVKTLGAGHYCDAHACKAGCKTDANCDSTKGETCDTSTSPGHCIQCRTSQDCLGNPNGAACDNTGHCVECYGTSADTAKAYCGGTKPECDLGSKTCVQCITAHNPDGADCGYPSGGSGNVHDTETCSPSTHSCVDGCQVDAQCGQLTIKDQNGFPTGLDNGNTVIGTITRASGATVTWHSSDERKCDTARTTTPGITTATLGGCVQCLTNADCHYTVTGAPNLNGARCDKRTGTTYEMCVEGCDTDSDCPNNKICHLGQPGDANNNKCVDCVCDNPGADGTYCETTLAGGLACPLAGTDAKGNVAKVCDKDTLLCRKRRQNEQCLDSTQCENAASTDSCLPPSECIIQRTQTTGYKCDAAGTFGRCGTPCDDLQNNYCTGNVSCPAGSSCQQVEYMTDNSSTAGTACISSLCHN